MEKHLRRPALDSFQRYFSRPIPSPDLIALMNYTVIPLEIDCPAMICRLTVDVWSRVLLNAHPGPPLCWKSKRAKPAMHCTCRGIEARQKDYESIDPAGHAWWCKQALVEETLADRRTTETRDTIVTTNLTLEFVIVREFLVFLDIS